MGLVPLSTSADGLSGRVGPLRSTTGVLAYPARGLTEPVLTPEARFYQRLLAADHREARQILEQHLEGKSLQELYESVVIPALGLAERDRTRMTLTKQSNGSSVKSKYERINRGTS